MILFFSFILTVIVYLGIIVFLFSLVPKEKKEDKKIYVHTAIIAKKAKVIKNGNKQITKTTQTSKIKKTSKRATKKRF